jgi:hypothetical protein
MCVRLTLFLTDYSSKWFYICSSREEDFARVAPVLRKNLAHSRHRCYESIVVVQPTE